jgi:hypothetical protein
LDAKSKSGRALAPLLWEGADFLADVKRGGSTDERGADAHMMHAEDSADGKRTDAA